MKKYLKIYNSKKVKSMVKCPRCGFDSKEGKFCISCGQPLSNIENQDYNENPNDEKITFTNPNGNFQNNLIDKSDYQNVDKAPYNNYNPPQNNQSNLQDNRPIPDNSQANIPVQTNSQVQNPYDNQGFNYQGYNQQNVPVNQKSKIVGFLLNFFIPGLGYGYVNKWKEGIIIFLANFILTTIGWVLAIFLIGFIFLIAAFLLWIYSLIKTMDMIDNYNKGLPY